MEVLKIEENERYRMIIDLDRKLKIYDALPFESNANVRNHCDFLRDYIITPFRNMANLTYDYCGQYDLSTDFMDFIQKANCYLDMAAALRGRSLSVV